MPAPTPPRHNPGKQAIERRRQRGFHDVELAPVIAAGGGGGGEYGFDQFDPDACRRWAEGQGLRIGEGYAFQNGNYGTKGLYAYRDGRYAGCCCESGGGGVSAWHITDRHLPDSQTLALVEAARRWKLQHTGTNTGRISKRWSMLLVRWPL